MWRTATFGLTLVFGVATASADNWEDCVEKQDPDRSVQACTAIITEGASPKLALANTYRCRAYKRKQDYESALADCDKALELDSKLARAYHWRCEVYAYRKEFDKAVGDCDKAIELLDDAHLNRAYLDRCWVIAGRRTMTEPLLTAIRP